MRAMSKLTLLITPAGVIITPAGVLPPGSGLAKQQTTRLTLPHQTAHRWQATTPKLQDFSGQSQSAFWRPLWVVGDLAPKPEAWRAAIAGE